MLCGLIMAGGRGERFWPLSTDERPKQFINLLGSETMIQLTARRLESAIPIERIFVVTGKQYVDLVKQQLPGLPERNIIIEPVGRNTAPCIALSAFTIEKYYNDTTLVVVPADHLIRDEEKFIDTLCCAEKFIVENREAIVTLGIEPDRAETGYGYIKYSTLVGNCDCFKIHGVEKFVEKPDIKTAEKYLHNGSYLWNSGMFIWKTSTIKKYTNQFMPHTYGVISEIFDAIGESYYEEILEHKYTQVESISVDYAIMEKTSNIYVIPSSFGWDDIGTWHSIERYRTKDAHGNILVGSGKISEGTNNIVFNNSKRVLMSGVDDMVVIETDDMIFITTREKLEEIKNIKSHFTM